MLKNFTLQTTFLSLLFTFFITLPLTNLQSQVGCPGCLVDVPANMAADTIYLDSIPNGIVSTSYDEDISFRLPKTTTPVAANDSTISPGIDLDEIKITAINNLPPGLNWQTNADNYFPDTDPDGCVRLCGTPLVAGTYVLDILLEVKVSILTQESSFQRVITILPSSTVNDGFVMTNNLGCGEVTVDFQNNVPSNGNNGYSYLWDFGNGNVSFNENPPSQTYSTPGVYPVDYQAVIDTSGYILTKVRVIDADCSDFFTDPDLYLDIMDPNGNSMVTYEITNASTPVEFILNIPLIDGTYTMVVKDEDGGLNGQDDECDFYTFNKLSDGILVNGGSSVDLTILHPVDTIQTSDSVYVYPVPDQPEVFYEAPLIWCENEMVTLNSSYSTGNQWMLNGMPINGATEQQWLVLESGNYSVVHTNDFGCASESEVEEITFIALPTIPIYNNTNNLLQVVVPAILPNDYSLQWYYENTILPGETELSYCMTQTGSYTLIVTDNETGCTNSYTNNQNYNAEYVCGVLGIEDLTNEDLKIYPNPFQENLFVEFSLDEVSDFQINVFDIVGRKMILDKQDNFIGDFNKKYTFDNWSAGVYLMEIDFGQHQIHRKIVIQK